MHDKTLLRGAQSARQHLTARCRMLMFPVILTYCSSCKRVNALIPNVEEVYLLSALSSDCESAVLESVNCSIIKKIQDWWVQAILEKLKSDVERRDWDVCGWGEKKLRRIENLFYCLRIEVHFLPKKGFGAFGLDSTDVRHVLGRTCTLSELTQQKTLSALRLSPCSAVCEWVQRLSEKLQFSFLTKVWTPKFSKLSRSLVHSTMKANCPH